MEFSYYELKKWAQNGERIGNWNGSPVFVCSCNDLINKGSSVYYILYDDESKIVKNKHDEWYVYGTVRKDGSIDEYSSPRKYNIVKSYTEAVAASTSTSTYTPGYEVESPVVGDIKTEIDVEATLKMAREISIDDLLAGFNYGL
jgi:hypothetical protein